MLQRVGYGFCWPHRREDEATRFLSHAFCPRREATSYATCNGKRCSSTRTTGPRSQSGLCAARTAGRARRRDALDCEASSPASITSSSPRKSSATRSKAWKSSTRSTCARAACLTAPAQRLRDSVPFARIRPLAVLRRHSAARFMPRESSAGGSIAPSTAAYTRSTPSNRMQS